MGEGSKNCPAAVNSGSDAINLARPVRSGRNCSLTKSRYSFTINDSGGETVADALAHLLPAAEICSSGATNKKTMRVEDSADDENGHPVSPLAPGFSPLTPTNVDEARRTSAGISIVHDKRTPELSCARGSKKRKASPDVPITPPPRHLRQKTGRSTATFKTTSKSKKSSAPKTTGSFKAASVITTKQSVAPAPQKVSQTSTSPGQLSGRLRRPIAAEPSTSPRGPAL
ncbi:hypothetical protein QM012_005415 [Aureobasidium pullulans]|uniref:Uncharacterized protein n=1 Tax=Aureobasidium pullulans TaxID=5580 RepID=A0ABR0T5F3_AURPU